MKVLSLSLMICPSVGSSPSPVSPATARGGGGGGGGEQGNMFVTGYMNDVACSYESVNGYK